MTTLKNDQEQGSTAAMAGGLLCGMFLLAFAPAVAFLYNLARTEPFTAVNHAVTCVAFVAALPWAAMLFVHLRDARREKERSLWDTQSTTLLLSALTLVPVITGVAAQSIIIGALLVITLGVVGLPISGFLMVGSLRHSRAQNRAVNASGDAGADAVAVASTEPDRRLPMLLTLSPLPVGAAATLTGLLFTASANVMVQGATGAALFVIAMAAVAAGEIGGKSGMRRHRVLLLLGIGSLSAGGAVAAMFLSAWTATVS